MAFPPTIGGCTIDFSPDLEKIVFDTINNEFFGGRGGTTGKGPHGIPTPDPAAILGELPKLFWNYVAPPGLNWDVVSQIGEAIGADPCAAADVVTQLAEDWVEDQAQQGLEKGIDDFMREVPVQDVLAIVGPLAQGQLPSYTDLAGLPIGGALNSTIGKLSAVNSFPLPSLP